MATRKSFDAQLRAAFDAGVRLGRRPGNNPLTTERVFNEFRASLGPIPRPEPYPDNEPYMGAGRPDGEGLSRDADPGSRTPGFGQRRGIGW